MTLDDEMHMESLIGQAITGIGADRFEGEPCIVLVLSDGRELWFEQERMLIKMTMRYRPN